VPVRPLNDVIPAALRRKEAPAIGSLSEPEVARHYGRLGRLNFNLHQGLYPLGSCTMKYNPAVNEALARLDDFADLHPYHPQGRAQGALRLMWELEQALRVITGMDRMSLQPAAGAHGEWTGLRMIQAYHRSRGETRDEVLVPDSAHGTNPASATLTRLKTVTVKSGRDGEVDLEDFSDGNQSNDRLFLPATAFNRFAVSREINDGLLSPRFAPSQRAWVQSGKIHVVSPSVNASVPQDGDNR